VSVSDAKKGAKTPPEDE
jgi:hypothetical protein